MTNLFGACLQQHVQEKIAASLGSIAFGGSSGTEERPDLPKEGGEERRGEGKLTLACLRPSPLPPFPLPFIFGNCLIDLERGQITSKEISYASTLHHARRKGPYRRKDP